MSDSEWLARWRDGRIGFHRDSVHTALAKFWPVASNDSGGTVFVPLCGKSIDMCWLAECGHEVVGIELSDIAVTEFFQSVELEPEINDVGTLSRYRAGPYTLYRGDFFDLDASQLANCAALYDRAALIALPPPIRARYMHHLAQIMPQSFAGLLITLEYDQSLMDGPPFGVLEPEIKAHAVENALNLQLLERRDVRSEETRFVERGVRQIHETSWAIGR